MTNALSKFIDIRKGERSQVFTVLGVMLLVVGAHVILETARDALFLGTVAPRHLALVYAALAGLVLIALVLNRALVRVAGRRNALIGTLMLFSYGTVVFYLVPQTKTTVFALYLWSGLLGTVVLVQFWMLAGQLFTVAQGKRLFGLLAAGASAGAFLGAGFAAIILRFTSVSSLLLVSAGMFLVASWMLTSVTSQEVTLPPRILRPKSPQTGSTWKLFREQRYLSRIILVVLFSTVTFLTVDYLFKSVATRAMVGEANAVSAVSNELGSFFAYYYSLFGAVALLVQLLLSGYVVRRFGVLAAICILPAALLLGGAGTAMLGGMLAVVIVTKGVDGSLRHSLHRVTMELLWLPVGSDIREVAKGPVDGVLVRVTQAGVAALLFILAQMHLDTPRILSALIVASSLLWLIVVLALRAPYLAQFRSAIARESLEAGTELDLNSAQVLVEALSSPDAGRVVAAMELLAAKGRLGLIPSLILYHEAPLVLIKALGVIGVASRRDWVQLGQRLLTHRDVDVRIAALQALAKSGNMDGIQDRLRDTSPAVRAHATFRVVHHESGARGQDGAIDADPRVREILDMEGAAGTDARLALLDAISDSGDELWAGVILRLADSPDLAIIEKAIWAMTTVRDQRFIPILVDRLGIRRGRGMVRAAIVSLGAPALECLETALRDTRTDRRVRLHIPKTIARFGTAHSAQFLLNQLGNEEDGMIRYKILSSLARMAADHGIRVDRKKILQALRRNLIEHLRLLSLRTPLSQEPQESQDGRSGDQYNTDGGQLLCSLLDDKLKQSLQRCFLLLQIAHSHEDIRSAYFALLAEDRHQRANAIEFVDTLTRTPFYDGKVGGEVREWLQLIVDDLPPQDKVARSRGAVNNPPQSYQEAVSLLLSDGDEITASIAAFHVFEVGLKDLKPQVVNVLQRESVLNALGNNLQDLLALEGV